MIGGLDQGVSMGELIEFRDKWLKADSVVLLLAGLYALEMENRGLKLTRADYLADFRQRRYPDRLINKTLHTLGKMGLILPDRRQEVPR